MQYVTLQFRMQTNVIPETQAREADGWRALRPPLDVSTAPSRQSVPFFQVHRLIMSRRMWKEDDDNGEQLRI
jgi:hypothetical protein